MIGNWLNWLVFEPSQQTVTNVLQPCSFTEILFEELAITFILNLFLLLFYHTCDYWDLHVP